MRNFTEPQSFGALGWRLTLLNAAVFATLLVAPCGWLYLSEAASTDHDINQALQQTTTQELQEDPVRLLSQPQAVVDPPHPFSPLPLQAFPVLLDAQGHVHKGLDLLVAGLPDRAALMRVLHTGNADRRDVMVHGLHLRIATVPVRAGADPVVGVVQAFISLQGRDAELQRILAIICGGALGSLVIAIIGARFLAGRALVPIHAAFDQQRQFVADAAHELRTPLTLLQADVEIVQRALRPLEEPYQVETPVLAMAAADGALLAEIQAEISHMSALIVDLLTLAQVDAGVLLRRHDLVSLADGVREVVSRLEMRAQRQGITLEHHIPDDGDALLVQGDPMAFRRLLLVLMENALIYTPAGGYIEITGQTTPHTVILTVRDTGQGIVPSDLPHVFTRFYRADHARTPAPTKTAEHPGTGLGLAIAQAIVRQHGGVITVKSAGDGQGSTFTMTFPSGAPRPAHQEDTGRKRV
jgi:signal transduction histidine kinase